MLADFVSGPIAGLLTCVRHNIALGVDHRD